MHILIVGIRGFLGRALADYFKAQGHRVIGVSRTASDGIFSWSEFEKLNSLPYHTIINLCGEPILGKRWSAAYKEKLVSSRLVPTKALIKKIENSKVKPQVFIQGSAIGFYPSGITQGPYTEKDLPGVGFLPELCQNWEKASHLHESAIRRIVLRTGIVLNKNKGTYRSLRFPFVFGLGGLIGNGRQVMPWIHLDDFCRLVNFVIENQKIIGPLNATAPTKSTQKEFANALASILHTKSRTKIPSWLVKILLGQASTLILDGSEIVPQKALDHGFEFKFPSLALALRDLEKK